MPSTPRIPSTATADGEPILTVAAARSVDRAAQGDLGIPGIVLMENAAIGMAAIAGELLTGPGVRAATIVCGPGNNGGDGFAIARHLANIGVSVRIVPIGVPRPGGDAAIQCGIVRRMGLPHGDLALLGSLGAAELVVDALLGSGLDRPVEGELRRAIEAMNAAADRGRPVLAVDTPSGLDADSGEPLPVAVRATVTAMTLARRPACLLPAAGAFLGSVRIVSIGCPPSLVRAYATYSS